MLYIDVILLYICYILYILLYMLYIDVILGCGGHLLRFLGS